MRRKGLQARLGLLWSGLRVQPSRFILWRQDDGHTVVNLRDQRVRSVVMMAKLLQGRRCPSCPILQSPAKANGSPVFRAIL